MVKRVFVFLVVGVYVCIWEFVQALKKALCFAIPDVNVDVLQWLIMELPLDVSLSVEKIWNEGARYHCFMFP